MSAPTFRPGTPAACTSAPIGVERHIDGDWYGVTLDLTGQTDMLRQLAQAIFTRPELLAEFQVLGLNNSESSKRRDIASNLLLDHPSVRAALTVTVDGPAANDLGIAIIDAADDRVCCHCQHRAVAERSSYCPPCQDAVDHIDSVRAS